MILRALTLGLCLAGLTACSASQNLLARGVAVAVDDDSVVPKTCLLYTSPSPRDP